VHWDLCAPGTRFVYWGLIYCLERAATEFWKYFIREEDQRKYGIPMQFGIMGKPMKDARKRSPRAGRSWSRSSRPRGRVIAIAAEGFTVASIETYKTFGFPNKPRGKFAGKPILHPEYLERRRGFVPVYATIWALVAIHLAWALADSGWHHDCRAARHRISRVSGCVSGAAGRTIRAAQLCRSTR
jgi:hypothetical protein